MTTKNKQAIRARIGGLDKIKKVGEVAEALRHFLATDFNKTVVHPVPGKGSASSQRLCAFILVMREGKVLSAAVKIKTITQEIERHHNTFGMPTRSTLAPRRWP